MSFERIGDAFLYKSKTGEGQVRASQKTRGRVIRVVAVEQIVLGMQGVAQEQFHDHFAGSELR